MIVENPISITEDGLRELARRAKGRITRIFLHWTAGHYGQVYDEYHLNVDRDGTVYVTCDDLGERKAHTWQRNSGTVGITLCCGYGACCRLPYAIPARAAISAVQDGEERTPYQAEVDYGTEPPTPIQIEVLSKVVAILTEELGLVNSEDAVTTHCEIAFTDGYGPGSGDPLTKWDLWFLPDNAQNGRLYHGGLVIRSKAAFYRKEMRREAGAA